MAPAYNEAATVEDSVLSLLALDYPRFEVIVINDGSRDDTLDVLKKRFDLEPVERDYEPAAAHAPIRGIYRSRDEREAPCDRQGEWRQGRCA